MTAAALVTGNTVVLKPSSDAPGIATMFLEAAEEAGVPPGVLNFLTGGGSTVGNTLVEHPKVRMIAFTGSRDVGVGISEKAGKVLPGQRWIKRAVLEMGGKDFILVDETADLEEAAKGVVAAAFGFQGQKCSACSRLIVHEKVHDELLEKVVARTKALAVGDVSDPANAVGAVINERAQKKILEYVEIGRREGRIVAGGSPGPAEGFFVMPTVVDEIEPGDRLAREEIFGPVLAVLKVKDFDEGIAVANDTEYGLTGSLYSRDRQRLERGKRELFCGNLYLNRKCTGALVGVHPFAALSAGGKKVWELEGGAPYMPPPKPIKDAMTAALAKNETRYAPSSGVRELRRAILEKVRGKNAIPADDESPIVVNGGMHGLFAAFATLLDPEDEVLMFSPYWTPIVDVIRYHSPPALLVPAERAPRESPTAALA